MHIDKDKKTGTLFFVDLCLYGSEPLSFWNHDLREPVEAHFCKTLTHDHVVVFNFQPF